MPHYVDGAILDILMDIVYPEPESEPMRRLVIDDVRVFNFDVTRYARTPQDAITAIRDDGPWDETFWDHDLGSSLDETLTVYPVLMMVLEAAFYGSPYHLGKCFIHTDNPVGRDTLSQLGKYYEIIHIDAGPLVKEILPH